MQSDFGITPQSPSQPETQLATLQLGGFRVVCARREALLSVLLQRIAHGDTTALVFANANMVVQCAPWREKFTDSRVIVANDGIAMDLAARLLFGRRFVDNLNGTDFTPYLLEHCGRPMRLFLYGGRPESLVGAAARLSAMGHIVVDVIDGYSSIADSTLLARLQAACAEIVLVALGNPTQELWVLENLDLAPAAIYLAVGACFDFLSGRAKRAPQFLRALHLEWAFRLLREPRRLLRRYTLGGLQFVAQCWRERHSSKHHGP